MSAHISTLIPLILTSMVAILPSTARHSLTCLPLSSSLKVPSEGELEVQCNVTVPEEQAGLYTIQWVASEERMIANESNTDMCSSGVCVLNSIVNVPGSSPVFVQKVDLIVILTKEQKADVVEDERVFELVVGSYTNLILIVVSAVATILILLVISVLVLRYRRRRRAFGESEGDTRRASNDSDPWQEVDLRPGHIVAGELGQSAPDGDNDSFASADDIGVLNVAFDDAIDNLTSIANDNFSNRPISRFIAQMSRGSEQEAVEIQDVDEVVPVGRARVAIGGGADTGAGQVNVRDHEEVDVLQRDLGSGYTTIRQPATGDIGFIPTTSLIFQ